MNLRAASFALAKRSPVLLMTVGTVCSSAVIALVVLMLFLIFCGVAENGSQGLQGYFPLQVHPILFSLASFPSKIAHADIGGAFRFDLIEHFASILLNASMTGVVVGIAVHVKRRKF